MKKLQQNKPKKKGKKVKHPLNLRTVKQRAMAGAGIALGSFLLNALVNTIFDLPPRPTKIPQPDGLRVLTDDEFKKAQKEAEKSKENERI